jgi:Fic-DOC domain mobile mystery protein B
VSDRWTSIEGETPIDPSGLRDKTIKTRRQLHWAEAENIRQVFTKYLVSRPTRKRAPFTLAWMCRLHKEMYGRVWKWAGKLRTEDLNIGVPWWTVQTQLFELEKILALWHAGSDVPLPEQVARLHHRAVWIHPFLNGNGRWARLLANICLYARSGQLTVWPEDHIASRSNIRDEYLQAIRDADRGNFEPLIGLHERYIREAPAD